MRLIHINVVSTLVTAKNGVNVKLFEIKPNTNTDEVKFKTIFLFFYFIKSDNFTIQLFLCSTNFFHKNYKSITTTTKIDQQKIRSAFIWVKSKTSLWTHQVTRPLTTRCY